MLKVSYIIENKKKVINALSKRNFDATKIIGRLEDYNSKRKKIQLELENILSESNKLSKEIGILIKSGNKNQVDKIKEQTIKFKETSKEEIIEDNDDEDLEFEFDQEIFSENDQSDIYLLQELKSVEENLCRNLGEQKLIN